MSLAVENFKFFIQLFPFALISGGGLGLVETVKGLDKKKTQNPSIWEKAKFGVGVSVVSLSMYSSIQLLGIITKNSRYSELAADMRTTNFQFTILMLPFLYKGIDRNLNNLEERVKVASHNFAAMMISALVGAVGLILFDTIANTYLGNNLNAKYLGVSKLSKVFFLYIKSSPHNQPEMLDLPDLFSK